MNTILTARITTYEAMLWSSTTTIIITLLNSVDSEGESFKLLGDFIHRCRLGVNSHFGWWNSQDLLKHAGVAVEPESVSLESQAARDQRIMDLFAEGVPDSPGVSEDEDEFDHRTPNPRF